MIKTPPYLKKGDTIGISLSCRLYGNGKSNRMYSGVAGRMGL